MKDKKHIITVFGILLVVVVIAIFVDRMLQPKSYNKFGHYRWDAVGELQSQKIINQNIKTCAECHKNIYQLHEKDAHYSVPCVDCHGAGNLHVAFHRKDSTSKGITKEQAVMEKEFKLEGCLYCHRKLKARPSDFPQVDQKEHYKFLNVTNPDTKCIDCHSPHEPVFLLTEVQQSKLHPIVYKCTDCHATKPEKSFKEVADHPKIFECKDCHTEIVKDFETKPHHKYVECRTCHLFHKEGENIGRMYKNGNSKFCLLCHENKPFKDPKYPPKVKWPEHIGKLDYLVNINQKICLNCHTNQIHKMNLKSNPNPHANGWKADHKKYAKNDKNPSIMNAACQSCHTKDFCISCHKVDIPHPDGFLDNHKNVVAKKGKAVCANCHKPEFCSQCH